MIRKNSDQELHFFGSLTPDTAKRFGSYPKVRCDHGLWHPCIEMLRAFHKSQVFFLYCKADLGMYPPLGDEKAFLEYTVDHLIKRWALVAQKFKI